MKRGKARKIRERKWVWERLIHWRRCKKRRKKKRKKKNWRNCLEGRRKVKEYRKSKR